MYHCEHRGQNNNVHAIGKHVYMDGSWSHCVLSLATLSLKRILSRNTEYQTLTSYEFERGL